MRKVSIVVAGYYGFGNAGDELILRGLLDLLREKYPGAPVTVLSKNPERTARNHEVQAEDRWCWWRWPGLFLRASHFVLGGGGLLQESTGPWNHAYYLFLVVLAKLCGCRTEVLAIGVDPIRHSFNRWWTRFVFNYFVDQASVRDVDSVRALESVGVYRRINRMPDLVFRLGRRPASGDLDKPLRLMLALSRWDQQPDWAENLGVLVTRVIHDLRVPVDLVPFFPEEDESLAHAVEKVTGGVARVRLWEDPRHLLEWVFDYDLVVGMRYHALVLAAAAGKAFIGWGFQSKIRSICQEFSQPLWPFERGWNSEAVFRQIGETWRRRAFLAHRFHGRLPTGSTLTAPPRKLFGREFVGRR